jgi:hypothetical protein
MSFLKILFGSKFSYLFLLGLAGSVALITIVTVTLVADKPTENNSTTTTEQTTLIDEGSGDDSTTTEIIQTTDEGSGSGDINFEDHKHEKFDQLGVPFVDEKVEEIEDLVQEGFIRVKKL